MLAEISLLQYFSVYLGHPIYSLGVCLFSLILATGLGSLASHRLDIGSSRGMLVWGAVVVAYLLGLQQWLTDRLPCNDGAALPVRIAVSLLTVMPLGFLLGFAFPTGMKLVEAVDDGPTPWFWGINGATGVLASVLAVMVGIGFGINVTMAIAAAVPGVRSRPPPRAAGTRKGGRAAIDERSLRQVADVDGGDPDAAARRCARAPNLSDLQGLSAERDDRRGKSTDRGGDGDFSTVPGLDDAERPRSVLAAALVAEDEPARPSRRRVSRPRPDAFRHVVEIHRDRHARRARRGRCPVGPAACRAR